MNQLLDGFSWASMEEVLARSLGSAISHARVMAYKIVSVVGARPNFMKVAAICEAIKSFNRHPRADAIEHVLVHTGQHYDTNMSDLFFNDLELPKPDLSLGVGSGSHSAQTAKMMERFENVVIERESAMWCSW